MASCGAAPRRHIISALAALATVFLLFQVYRDASPRQRETWRPAVGRPSGGDGLSPWNHRAIHYPVENLTPLPSGSPKRLPTIQHRFGAEAVEAEKLRLQRRQHVKEVFMKCWQSYKTRAWMRDELSPISGEGRDSFGGWAATLVDALDTLWIMDLKADFHEAVAAANKIDFSTSTDDIINVFETTIRYLGGFLAAYDLSGSAVLLDKAIEVGEMLLVAFDTPNHMPITRWNWKRAASGVRQEAASAMVVAELGTFSLEFTRLSQLTGDMRWYDAIDRITALFDSQQNRTLAPGLWPIVANPRDEDLTGDPGFTLGGMADSLYEYFPKEYILLGGLSPVYEKLYLDSMAAASKYLIFRPMTPTNEDILMAGGILASDDGTVHVTDPKNQHLTCFVGGMLALGGRLFSNEEHVDLGEKITKGCIWAYKNGPRGVMPEKFNFVPCLSHRDCSWDPDVWKSAILQQGGRDAMNMKADDIIAAQGLPEGFTRIDDPRYHLRPEALESVFIMYRITGDESYREAGWQMFKAIEEITTTRYGNAAVRNITASAEDGLPPKQDRMESFWLAETLKYAYLLYSEPGLISLDDYVLNTEAHPLRRPTL